MHLKQMLAVPGPDATLASSGRAHALVATTSKAILWKLTCQSYVKKEYDHKDIEKGAWLVHA
jgi:hypothetical protein